jgi:hypothetical protein
VLNQEAKIRQTMGEISAAGDTDGNLEYTIMLVALDVTDENVPLVISVPHGRFD